MGFGFIAWDILENTKFNGKFKLHIMLILKSAKLLEDKPIILPVGSNLHICLKHREESAFIFLYSVYSPGLRSIIKKIVKCEYLTEDVLQETFLKISRFIDYYDPKLGKLSTWVSRLARNCALDELKSRDQINRSKNIKIDDHLEEVEHQYNTSINVDAMDLRHLLTFLTVTQAEVINLVYIGGFTQNEIAFRLHLPISTIKSRVRVAIVKLRELLL